MSVEAEPIDGNQSRKPLASGELVVAPDGNVGTIVNLWSHARHWGFEKGACVEFREDWRVDYPVSQLRRPLIGSGSQLADATPKSNPRGQ